MVKQKVNYYLVPTLDNDTVDCRPIIYSYNNFFFFNEYEHEITDVTVKMWILQKY